MHDVFVLNLGHRLGLSEGLHAGGEQRSIEILCGTKTFETGILF